MEYKYFLVLLVISASVMLSIGIKERHRASRQLCCELVDLTEYIKNQINYFCTPTEDILSAYTSKKLEETGIMLFLRQNDRESAVKIISEKDKKLSEIYSDFLIRLGKSCPEEQILNCENAITLLAAYLSEKDNEGKKKSSAYSSICVIFGFMIALFIL